MELAEGDEDEGTTAYQRPGQEEFLNHRISGMFAPGWRGNREDPVDN